MVHQAISKPSWFWFFLINCIAIYFIVTDYHWMIALGWFVYVFSWGVLHADAVEYERLNRQWETHEE